MPRKRKKKLRIKDLPTNFREQKERVKELRNEIRPYCKTIEVAGQIRRRQRWIDRFDLVCIPVYYQIVRSTTEKYERPHRNFIDTLHAHKVLQGHARRDDFLQIELPDGMLYNLYITTAEKFGLTLLQATGNKKFLSKIKRELQKRDYYIDSNMLKNSYEKFSFPDEASFFRYLGWGYVYPQKRNH